MIADERDAVARRCEPGAADFVLAARRNQALGKGKRLRRYPRSAHVEIGVG